MYEARIERDFRLFMSVSPGIAKISKKSAQGSEYCELGAIYVSRSQPPACQYDGEGGVLSAESGGAVRLSEMAARLGLIVFIIKSSDANCCHLT